jgi:UPF0755 protein
MSKRSTLGCLVASGAAACIFLFALVGAGLYIENETVNTFGDAAQGIGPTDRLVYGLQLALGKADLLSPADPQGSPQQFEIRAGESVGEIAYRLEEAGLIRSADVFRIYLIYKGLDRSVQAGSYKIDPQKSAVDISRQIMDATPAEVTFRILAGWRVEEIGAALPTSGLSVTAEDLLQVVRQPPFGFPLEQPSAEITSLEGFLLPGAYTLSRQAGAEEIIRAFTQRFDVTVDADIRKGFTDQGLSLLQAVTLASMVQREAMVEDEQPLIASVFYNRLAKGMKLDSDPTVQYALGYNESMKTWWTNPLRTADLKVESPYNTYMQPGLPPGPIGNPGIAALRAVAYPAQSPYFYFRARCDGSHKHVFAETFEQHVQNACQ